MTTGRINQVANFLSIRLFPSRTWDRFPTSTRRSPHGPTGHRAERRKTQPSPSPSCPRHHQDSPSHKRAGARLARRFSRTARVLPNSPRTRLPIWAASGLRLPPGSRFPRRSGPPSMFAAYLASAPPASRPVPPSAHHSLQGPVAAPSLILKGTSLTVSPRLPPSQISSGSPLMWSCVIPSSPASSPARPRPHNQVPSP